MIGLNQIIWKFFYKSIKEQDADIVVANYYTFREEDAMFLFHVAETNEALVFQPNDSFFNYMFSTFGTDIAWGSSWSKLFKKSLFDRLLFSEDISWAEDFDLMYKLFLISERIIYLHKSPHIVIVTVEIVLLKHQGRNLFVKV